MKAILLSAGLGKRLRPITNTTPKCLIPVNNIPLIEYWFALFKKYNIKDVLINTFHLSEKIVDYMNTSKSNLNVKIIIEDKLYGSLGSIVNNKDFIEDDNSILIAYSDNLTNVNIYDLINFHNNSKTPITTSLFKSNNPKESGIVEVDKNFIITNFEEKPNYPKSDLANAGIYIFNKNIINSLNLNNQKINDIGHDLLPKYIDNMSGFFIKDYIIDIGSHSNLEIANNYASQNEKLFFE